MFSSIKPCQTDVFIQAILQRILSVVAQIFFCVLVFVTLFLGLCQDLVVGVSWSKQLSMFEFEEGSGKHLN